MNIFVGNLSFEVAEADLKKLFETMGEVASAVIVMEKEKKAPKSRGFGFVEMPDHSQALAAIAALNNKEFMGRALNVNPTRPKTETQRQSELEKRIFLKAKAKIRSKTNQYQQDGREEKQVSARPYIPKPGTYKGGRRTISYIKRHGLAGIQEEAKPWWKTQKNPMRWRKRGVQPKPWQKSSSEPKPWQKAESGSEPGKKPMGNSKPWRKRSRAKIIVDKKQ